jgi:integrase/recombinase XerD
VRDPTLGLTHLQFEALRTAARGSTNNFDFAPVTMLGLLGLRIFEATGSDIEDLGEEHGHRVLRVPGKGDKAVLVSLPPAVGRAIERGCADRTRGAILLTSRATRMDRHCATRRLRRLTEQAGQDPQDASPPPKTHTPASLASWTTSCAALATLGISSSGKIIAPSSNEIRYRVIP